MRANCDLGILGGVCCFGLIGPSSAECEGPGNVREIASTRGLRTCSSLDAGVSRNDRSGRYPFGGKERLGGLARISIMPSILVLYLRSIRQEFLQWTRYSRDTIEFDPSNAALKS